MHDRHRSGGICGPVARSWVVLLVLALSGCGALTVAQRNQVGAVAATALLGHIPTSNIQQVYYLGVFDPRDQLQPMFYRVRVQGQASAIARTGFASGWVRAELVDSLSGRVSTPFDKPVAPQAEGAVQGNGATGAARADQELKAGALSGRRLMLFGPEGFREAPANHRLVIVMGADPSAFFSGVDQALGLVAQATQSGQDGPEIERLLWDDLARAQLQRERVELLLEATP